MPKYGKPDKVDKSQLKAMEDILNNTDKGQKPKKKAPPFGKKKKK